MKKQCKKLLKETQTTSQYHSTKLQNLHDTSKSNNLKYLGKKTNYYFDYNPNVLESIPNLHSQSDYFVKFNCPEFTALCPITGQPDFATLYISYIPDFKLIESKSLKLYLFSFRCHGGFHEECINIIARDLIEVLQPRYLEVWGKFTPRGGLSIDPYVNYGKEGTKFIKMAKKRLMLHDLYPETITNR
ncbi:preQ(1) synthase [Helicobacter sp. MIT 14-3879]|uniref:preQ(1) synthase n=1 Tax=Helicobacter sp. MIT 14-3879 TaxID=2040649 RepID=UPI000E1F35AB|nr:preQ(1) synthase [Helicobacter sp. MIT 14-3879]RDU60401.1 NADPH-dependent 7-cyano-7-deazaguanine reductase QueF [Helicobacter sp. MIT 14-3879]